MPIQYGTYAVPRADLGVAMHEFEGAESNCIADLLLPPLLVRKKAATLSVVTRENLKVPDDLHANGAAFNRIGLTVEDKAYACIDRGLEETLTDEDRQTYVADFDAEVEKVQHIGGALALKREIRAKDLLFNTTTWTGSALTTDVSAAPWDAAASDVLGHVLAAKEKVRKGTGVEADSMLIGAVTMNNLLANTAILGRFQNTVTLTEQLLRANMASIFGLQNLYVGRAVYDSADEGQTFTGADVWADDYALIFRKQAGSLTSPGLGRHVIWDLMSADVPTVVQYREEQTESDVFRVRRFEIAQVWDAYFGHLLTVDA